MVGRTFPDSNVRQVGDSRERSRVFALGSLDALRFDRGSAPELDSGHDASVRQNIRRRRLSDQVKSGQWWSGQNRPTDVARDVILLAHFLLVRQVRFRAPAPWPAFQDVTVV